jgi:3'-phosphoadenosine 5'-phosphosulfate sulfotransferase (PAPS reductase)/FAD synthetase
MKCLKDMDHIVIAFSGGKDSIGCVISALEAGIPKEKIELWHHSRDGEEGSTLMDWPGTPSYCRAFADAMGLPIFFSWKVGGFEREMLRNKQKTAPTKFEDQDHNIIECGGVRGKEGTRMKFPQVSPDLSVRWCSAYLKVDVCTAAINNQERFLNKKTVVITGERAQESASRAKYKVFEPDRADNRDGKLKKRHVDHWRPVHAWPEEKIWEKMEEYRINPHPAYKLGWGRLSCMACIFGNKNQWASVKKLDPVRFEKIATYEKSFGCTIHRNKSVQDLVQEGRPYVDMNILDIIQALDKEYKENIFVNDWKLPQGAFGDSDGPT